MKREKEKNRDNDSTELLFILHIITIISIKGIIHQFPGPHY